MRKNNNRVKCSAKKCDKPLHPNSAMFCAKHRDMAMRGKDFTTRSEGSTPIKLGRYDQVNGKF